MVQRHHLWNMSRDGRLTSQTIGNSPPGMNHLRPILLYVTSQRSLSQQIQIPRFLEQIDRQGKVVEIGGSSAVRHKTAHARFKLVGLQMSDKSSKLLASSWRGCCWQEVQNANRTVHGPYNSKASRWGQEHVLLVLEGYRTGGGRLLE